MRTALAIATLLFATASLADESYPYEDGLRELLAEEGRLYDPDSAIFQDLVYHDTGHREAWCGKFNARNRYGGMAGWHYFNLVNGFRAGLTLHIGDRYEIEKACKASGTWVRSMWYKRR